MAISVPERIAWAVEVMDVRPGEKILEIGCGRGYAISPICAKLETGHLTAIDRSPEMAAFAASANLDEFLSGKTSIIQAELSDAELPAHHFDKIFLFNLNVFWMDPSAELAEIKKLLTPDGRFYLFHQPPPGHDVREFAAVFEKNLESGGFEIIEISIKSLEPVEAVCVVSRCG